MPNRKESGKRRRDSADDSLGSEASVQERREDFKHVDALQSTDSTDAIPILIEEVAPTDFFFPLSGIQVLAKLHTFNLHQSGMTHVWLRGVRPTDGDPADTLLAEYVCRNEIRALILYPWASNGVLQLTKGKPSDRQIARFSCWSQDLSWNGDCWGLKFEREGMRRFVIDYLLQEQLSHHLTNTSISNRGAATAVDKLQEPGSTFELVEKQYAVIWSACGIRVIK